MRDEARGAAKFYTGGISVYPERELYREMTFIAYYLHWGADELLRLPHGERRRFCEEISRMHKSMLNLPKNPFEVD